MQTDKNTNSQARARLTALFDDGIYNEIGSAVMEKDSPAAVVTAFGYVNGNPVYAFSQDKSNEGGAVGEAQAKKIAKVYELAAKTGSPVVGIHDSNGAFVDGTAASLSAYGIMLGASAVVSGVVPQIAVIAGTCAGTAAMLACSSDFVVMTKESEFFMAPNTAAGSAEAAAKAGIASAVCDDETAAIQKARELVNILPVNNLASVPMFEFADAKAASGSDTRSVIDALIDDGSEIEICADYGKSYTGFATAGGSTVGVIGAGMGEKLGADDCAKLARFIRTCDAFSVPVITLVDSEGFDCGDTITSVKAMTTLANSYSEATTAKVALVTGKAIGPVFAATAGSSSNSDFTYAFRNAVIAPLSPLAFVEFTQHDKLKGAQDLTAERNKLADEYSKTLASADTAAENNHIDGVIEPSQVRATVLAALDILSGKRVQKLPKKHSNIQF